MLRVLIGERTNAPEVDAGQRHRSQHRRFEPAGARLRARAIDEAGALDASLSPLQMKKNRPGSLLRVIAKPEDQETTRADHFRRNIDARVCAFTPPNAASRSARIVEVETPYGKVRMKVPRHGAFAPEYEDCRALAMPAGHAAASACIAAAQ